MRCMIMVCSVPLMRRLLVVSQEVGCIARYLEAHRRTRIGVKTEVSNVCDPQRCCCKYTCQLARLLTGVGNESETRRVLS